MKSYFTTRSYRRRNSPDKRITLTKNALVIEYSNGLDIVLQKDDTRAKRILTTISLTATN